MEHGIAENNQQGAEQLPRTRKSVEEKIKQVREKKEQMTHQLEALEAKRRVAARKEENRFKIVLGGACKAHADIDPEFRKALDIVIAKAVAPRDRALVLKYLKMDAPSADPADSAKPAPSSVQDGAAHSKSPEGGSPAPPAPPRLGKPGPMRPGMRPGG